MSAVDPAVSAVDNALGEPAGAAAGTGMCAKCGRPLGTDSPSPDFCSENCQQLWRAEHATAYPGYEVLDRVRDFVARFNAFPSEHCAPMLALWYAHTHAAEHFYITPRLILSSVEPGSGKTRVLEVAQFLVKAPEMTISATTAALFRMVSEGPITILFDEVDTVFTAKGGNNEDLRGLLNAGYKRSATVARCVGDAKAMKVDRFPVFAPAALAGIAGNMPATITTRAITVHMKRRRDDEAVDEFWEEDVEAEAAPLRDMLAAWIDTVTDKISRGRPTMPEGVRDRSAEIWRPLIAIADAAGDHWPDTARAACSHFVDIANADHSGGGERLQLLADLRELFTARGVDELPTAEILTALHGMEESDWADLDGKPLDARRLAKDLRPYGVVSKNVRLPGDRVVKGYRVSSDGGLADAWSRYLPTNATAATPATPQVTPVADTQPVAATAATAVRPPAPP